MHGTTGSTQEWRDGGYVDALRARHQLVLIDQRGHGKSDKPHDPALYDWELLVDDVVAVLDDCGLNAPPDMLCSLCRLVHCPWSRHDAPRASQCPRTRWREHTMGRCKCPRPGVPIPGDGELSSRDPGSQRDHCHNETEIASWPTIPEAVAASLQGTRCLPSKEMLAQFSKPSFIFVGEQDPRLASSKEMVSWLPNAELAVVPGRDHYHTFFSSELVLPHLKRFLDRV